MNKIVYDLILKLEQCDDKHNRCDYLLEHDEITYLLEFIKPLYEKGKEIERLNNIIERIKRIKSIYQSLQFSAPENYYIFIEQLGEVLQEPKENK